MNSVALVVVIDVVVVSIVVRFVWSGVVRFDGFDVRLLSNLTILEHVPQFPHFFLMYLLFFVSVEHHGWL